MSKAKHIYIFRATLDENYGGRGKNKREIYREIAILETQNLSTLAKSIILSFDFDFDHCYGFYSDLKDIYSSKELFELFTDIGEEPTEGALGVEHTRVSKAFDRIGKKLLFLFDYGDNWYFIVELLEIKTSLLNVKYSKTLKSVGQAPEQYPPDEADIGEELHDSHGWFYKDCKICQELKKQGVKLQWFSDEPSSKAIKN